jgi:hypothetical protein
MPFWKERTRASERSDKAALQKRSPGDAPFLWDDGAPSNRDALRLASSVPSNV